MWNLLISATPDAWEHPTCRILARRFGEHSLAGFDTLALEDPATLRRVESFPAILIYEAGVEAPDAHVARYGSISRLRREDGDLVFEFTPDPERGFLPRGVLMSLADELGIHRFQWRRTHWAIMDGELPIELLRRGLPRPPPNGVPLLYAAYREAVRAGFDAQAAAVETGLNDLPPSEDKALAYLRSVHQDRLYLPAFCVLGYRRRDPALWEQVGRLHNGVEVVTDPEPQAGLGSLPFLLTAFYDRHGGPTECERMNEAAEDCLAVMAEVEADFRAGGAGHASLAYVMWRTGQSPVLARFLRRRLRLVIDRLMEDKPSCRIWPADDMTPDHRTTAMLSVGMLRVGDDKHRRRLRLVVKALCHFQRPDGGFAARGDDTTGDVLQPCWSWNRSSARVLVTN